MVQKKSKSQGRKYPGDKIINLLNGGSRSAGPNPLWLDVSGEGSVGGGKNMRNESDEQVGGLL